VVQLLKGQTAPRDGKFLTENEHRNLNNSIYIPEFDKIFSQDEVLKHIRRSGALNPSEKAVGMYEELVEKLTNRGIK
jgi:hypothetical protein